MALAPRTIRTRTTSKKESTPVEEVVTTVTGSNKKAQPLVLVLGTLLCLAVGVAGYFYYQAKYHGAEMADKKEIEELSKTIGAFMMLPDGETPTLATVTDKEKLSGQAFFEKAENGDKVLIYSNSGRAILYRPSTGKIVDVTVVNIDKTEATPENPTPTSAPVPEPQAETNQAFTTIALYNGSTKVGVTDTLEKQIGAGLPGAQVVVKEKASKNDYQGVTVIDLSGKNADKAIAIADLVGGSISTAGLPQGETAPQADILIMIGNSETPAILPVDTPKKN